MSNKRHPDCKCHVFFVYCRLHKRYNVEGLRHRITIGYEQNLASEYKARRVVKKKLGGK